MLRWRNEQNSRRMKTQNTLINTKTLHSLNFNCVKNLLVSFIDMLTTMRFLWRFQFARNEKLVFELFKEIRLTADFYACVPPVGRITQYALRSNLGKVTRNFFAFEC